MSMQIQKTTRSALLPTVVTVAVFCSIFVATFFVLNLR